MSKVSKVFCTQTQCLASEIEKFEKKENTESGNLSFLRKLMSDKSDLFSLVTLFFRFLPHNNFSLSVPIRTTNHVANQPLLKIDADGQCIFRFFLTTYYLVIFHHSLSLLFLTRVNFLSLTVGLSYYPCTFNQ